MDMEAGLEHIGRGTARRVDAMLAVVEPRMKSVDTINRILGLAKEIEVKEVLAVGNKIESSEEREFVEEQMKKARIPVAAMIPYDPVVAEADMLGVATIDHDAGSSAVRAVAGLMDFLKERYGF